jgi:hypothetical protein
MSNENYLKDIHARIRKLLSGEPLTLFQITQCMPDPEDHLDLSEEENRRLHAALFKYVGQKT